MRFSVGGSISGGFSEVGVRISGMRSARIRESKELRQGDLVGFRWWCCGPLWLVVEALWWNNDLNFVVPCRFYCGTLWAGYMPVFVVRDSNSLWRLWSFLVFGLALDGSFCNFVTAKLMFIHSIYLFIGW